MKIRSAYRAAFPKVIRPKVLQIGVLNRPKTSKIKSPIKGKKPKKAIYFPLLLKAFSICVSRLSVKPNGLNQAVFPKEPIK